MALEKMPSEVWQTILRCSIAIHVFFDPDPIESNGLEEYQKRYDDDVVYWKSERHRNILRQVCSGWNAYLLQFNHRLVQLEDIWKDLIPATSLKQAVRLQYSTWSRPLDTRIFDVVKKSLMEDEDWALEILDGGLLQIDELILQSNKVPHLQCMYTVDAKLPDIALWRPNIRLLDASLDTESTYEPLRLSYLTTLSILFPLVGVITCDFPSLKHLSIYSSRSAELSPQELIQLLEMTGKNLITLFDHHTFSEETLPNEIWALCPNLERFQTSFAFKSDTYISPSLDSFQISPYILSSDIGMDPSRFPVGCLRRAGITKVIFRDPWKIALSDYPDQLLEYVLYVMRHGISLYDIRGMKFQDMIVMLLQFRKTKKRTPVPGWNRQIRWF